MILAYTKLRPNLEVLRQDDPDVSKCILMFHVRCGTNIDPS